MKAFDDHARCITTEDAEAAHSKGWRDVLCDADSVFLPATLLLDLRWSMSGRL